MSKITCIIPFLNEGEEVKNTVKSIRIHSNSNVEIILVDDCSNDGMDYEKIAKQYNAIYHRNRINCGSTKSRDIGVNLCQTPYFLMLDGHMRFNNNDWVETIVQELDKKSNQLLCCQTSGFRIVDGCRVERPFSQTPYGAFINLHNIEQILNVDWLYTKRDDNLIPCVLGAAYASSTIFWKKIKGLEGLKGWGSEEPYISLKTWMFGSVCKLLPEIVVSHYYREQAPYVQVSANRIYNKMVIAETLLSESQKKEIFAYLKTSTKSVYANAFMDFWENRASIDSLKKYYQTNRIYDLSVIEDFNKSPESKTDKYVANELASIYELLKSHLPTLTEPGLYNGLIGIAIFLYHYASIDKSSLFVADACIDQMMENLDNVSSLDMATGLSGIGWGIEYLIQNKYCAGDTNELLKEVDALIEKVNVSEITDISIETGLGGITQYTLCRMHSAHMNGKSTPFSDLFIQKLSLKVSHLLEYPPNDIYESIDVFLRFNAYIKAPSHSEILMSIYDNFMPIEPKSVDIKSNLGLAYGLAGKGMNLLTNYFYSKQ